MKIADLFVDIDVANADKSVRSLEGVQEGVGGVASTSLEAKAAIVGMVYALQRLSSSSNAEGTALKSFAAMTGLSTKRLQQWQYAARQAGATNEEMTSSIANLQQKMMDALKGEGIPKAFAWLQQYVDLSDINSASDIFKLMERIQEFATKFKGSPALIAKELQELGLSEGVVSGMFQGAFNERNFAMAPYYTENQINALDQMRAQWTNLFDDIERGVARVNLDHMTDLLPEIRALVQEIFKMVDAFSELAKKLQIVKGMSVVFEGWSEIFSGVTNVMSGIDKQGGIVNYAKDLMPTHWATSNAPTTNNVEVNQTFQNPGDNANDVRRGTVEGINEAYKNFPRQVN